MSLDSYNKLSSNLQKLIEDISAEKQLTLADYFNKEDERRLLRLSDEFGMEMVDLDPGEKEKWEATVADAAEDYFLGVSPKYGQALIDKLKAAAGK